MLTRIVLCQRSIRDVAVTGNGVRNLADEHGVDDLAGHQTRIVLPRLLRLGCSSGRTMTRRGEGSLSACLPAYYIFLPLFAEFAQIFVTKKQKCLEIH